MTEPSARHSILSSDIRKAVIRDQALRINPVVVAQPPCLVHHGVLSVPDIGFRKRR